MSAGLDAGAALVLAGVGVLFAATEPSTGTELWGVGSNSPTAVAGLGPSRWYGPVTALR